MFEQVRSTLREARSTLASDASRRALARVGDAGHNHDNPGPLHGLARPVLTGMATAALVVMVIVGLAAGGQAAFAAKHKQLRSHHHNALHHNALHHNARSSAAPMSAEAACRAELPTHEGLERAVEQAKGRRTARHPDPLPLDGGEWQTILASSHEGYTVTLFANAVADDACLAGPEGRPAAISGGERSADERHPTPTVAPVDGMLVSGQGMMRASDEQPFEDVDGRVGAEVSGVTIVLSDGKHVLASVANGWFLAWWPGLEKAVAAEVTTTGGTTSSRQLDDPTAH